MSAPRKIAGLFIIVIMFGLVFPGLFYLLSQSVDSALRLPHGGTFALNINIFASAISLIIGLFWILWAYSYLHFVGKGSPVEAFGRALYPTQKLVTTGPYAFTRNPMVFGLLFVFLAIAFYTASPSGLVLTALISILMVLYIRAYEEPQLVHRFGRRYKEYRESIPVLIPTFRPGRSS